MRKPLSWDEAAEIARACQARGGRVVTSNGCFDLLHRGHVSYLQAARQLGDVLIVAINSDASVKKLKGPSRPLNKAEDRAYVLGALKCVDGVCIFEEDTPIEFLRAIKPDLHIKGADWRGKGIPEEAVLKEWNGRVHFLDYVDGYSTTSLIERSQKKD